jgi:N-acetylmuramoyl-L-alanine amidase CwlA
MVQIKQILAHPENYGGVREMSNLWIPIHYTANKNDTAENNGNYFAKNVVKTSAHFFVDDDSIVQSVPLDRIAYAVGGKKYANCVNTGGGKYYGKCTNANSISVELCGGKDGVYPSAKTIANAVELVLYLMASTNTPQDRVIRHFDVVGKPCPAYWCGSAKRNAAWKTEFWSKCNLDRKLIQDKTGLADGTMDWLATYTYASDLFRKLAAPMK